MIWTAIGFFALAAILGMLLLSYILRNKNTPKGLVFTHGPIAAVGIILLIIYCFMHSPRPIESLILFVVAALGGVVLIFKDITGKPVPKSFAIAHGAIAIIAFIFLVVFAFL